MAALKTSQVKAATLLEVIVAMVIILVVFVIATAIYTNVIRSSPTVKQQQGRALAEQMIAAEVLAKNWEERTEMLDSIVLQKLVSPYPADPDLLVMTVVATERGREIARTRRVIRKEADE